MLNSFEHCRAYMFYKFKGGRYNLKRARKPLHVRINFKINFKQTYIFVLYIYVATM